MLRHVLPRYVAYRVIIIISSNKIIIIAIVVLLEMNDSLVVLI